MRRSSPCSSGFVRVDRDRSHLHGHQHRGHRRRVAAAGDHGRELRRGRRHDCLQHRGRGLRRGRRLHDHAGQPAAGRVRHRAHRRLHAAGSDAEHDRPGSDQRGPQDRPLVREHQRGPGLRPQRQRHRRPRPRDQRRVFLLDLHLREQQCGARLLHRHRRHGDDRRSERPWRLLHRGRRRVYRRPAAGRPQSDLRQYGTEHHDLQLPEPDDRGEPDRPGRHGSGPAHRLFPRDRNRTPSRRRTFRNPDPGQRDRLRGRLRRDSRHGQRPRLRHYVPGQLRRHRRHRDGRSRQLPGWSRDSNERGGHRRDGSGRGQRHRLQRGRGRVGRLRRPFAQQAEFDPRQRHLRQRHAKRNERILFARHRHRQQHGVRRRAHDQRPWRSGHGAQRLSELPAHRIGRAGARPRAAR